MYFTDGESKLRQHEEWAKGGNVAFQVLCKQFTFQVLGGLDTNIPPEAKLVTIKVDVQVGAVGRDGCGSQHPRG